MYTFALHHRVGVDDNVSGGGFLPQRIDLSSVPLLYLVCSSIRGFRFLDWDWARKKRVEVDVSNTFYERPLPFEQTGWRSDWTWKPVFGGFSLQHAPRRAGALLQGELRLALCTMWCVFLSMCFFLLSRRHSNEGKKWVENQIMFGSVSYFSISSFGCVCVLLVLFTNEWCKHAPATKKRNPLRSLSPGAHPLTSQYLRSLPGIYLIDIVAHKSVARTNVLAGASFVALSRYVFGGENEKAASPYKQPCVERIETGAMKWGRRNVLLIWGFFLFEMKKEFMCLDVSCARLHAR